MLDLTAVFLIGLLGSAHCAGMCGGFVVALSQRPGQVYRRQALYFTGKTASYAALGALAGAVGALAGIALAGFQSLLSLTLGLVLVGLGLGLCGVFRRFGPTTLGQWASRYLARPISHLVASDRPAALVGLGALNGLLPCGLVYGMLALAATTSSAASGALTLAVFGLATLPALWATGRLSLLVRPVLRQRLQQASGVLVLALGLLTTARAASALALLDVTPLGGAAQHFLCLP